MINDYSVIMTVWKRKTFEEQLNAIISQKICPKEIFVIQCLDHVQLDTSKFKHLSIPITYIRSNKNLGFFLRFSVGLLCETKYIYILDDDVIPSPNWTEICLKICQKKRAIISSSGRIICKNNFEPERFQNWEDFRKYYIGDSNEESYNINLKERIVDFGCNSWFFKKEWLSYFWSISPKTINIAEDIHFSSACMILAEIKTIVPFQDGKNICGNLKADYGVDQHATWKKENFLEKRKIVLEYLIKKKKWKPILW